MNDLSFQALLENIKLKLDREPLSNIEWLTELLNVMGALSEEQEHETIQTLMTIRDDKKSFERIMRGLR